MYTFFFFKDKVMLIYRVFLIFGKKSFMGSEKIYLIWHVSYRTHRGEKEKYRKL